MWLLLGPSWKPKWLKWLMLIWKSFVSFSPQWHSDLSLLHSQNYWPSSQGGGPALWRGGALRKDQSQSPAQHHGATEVPAGRQICGGHWVCDPSFKLSLYQICVSLFYLWMFYFLELTWIFCLQYYTHPSGWGEEHHHHRLGPGHGGPHEAECVRLRPPALSGTHVWH